MSPYCLRFNSALSPLDNRLLNEEVLSSGQQFCVYQLSFKLEVLSLNLKRGMLYINGQIRDVVVVNIT